MVRPTTNLLFSDRRGRVIRGSRVAATLPPGQLSEEPEIQGQGARRGSRFEARRRPTILRGLSAGTHFHPLGRAILSACCIFSEDTEYS